MSAADWPTQRAVEGSASQARGYRETATGQDGDGAWRRVAGPPAVKFSGKGRLGLGYKIPVVAQSVDAGKAAYDGKQCRRRSETFECRLPSTPVTDDGDSCGVELVSPSSSKPRWSRQASLPKRGRGGGNDSR